MFLEVCAPCGKDHFGNSSAFMSSRLSSPKPSIITQINRPPGA
jgi:hypothetical protein